MYSDIEIPNNNTCLECNLRFDSPHELQNHKRKFCLHSGYDNLEGLAQREWQGGSPPHRPAFSNKQHLQKYGANSLAQAQQHPLTASNLNNDMRQIDRLKRQIERTNKYKHSQASLSQASSSKSYLNETRLTHNSYSESRLDEELKRYEKPVKEEADSSPTFIEQLNMKNHTMLDKSNSTMARMPASDKLEYARAKLDELNEIKTLYIQNGGNRPEFKANIDKMITFYQNFLQEQNERLKKEQNSHDLYGSQELIESRCSTPILKLREIDEQSQKGSKASINTNPSPKKQAKSKATPSNPQQQYPQYPGMPFGYPPLMMVPYPPPQQTSQSSDSMRLLQKMMELKSQENKQLMEILLQERKRSHPYPSVVQNSRVEPVSSMPGGISEGFKKDKKGTINVEQNYQFKKSMIEDLISEQKVLLALQQQQLDELKLLSQLPKQLQQLKLQSVIKSSQTRFQVEKELLKQKMQRLAYQQENQTFEEERKLNNDRWAGEQRKKLLEQQVDKYLDNFQSHFTEE